jgi:hypothetical protein
MKSRKLTNYLKDKIINNIINYSFPQKDLESMELKRVRIVNHIFRKTFPDYIVKSMDEHPGFFRYNSFFSCKYNDEKVTLETSYGKYPYNYIIDDLFTITDEESYNEYISISAEIEKFKKDRNKSRKEAKSIIDSVNTTNQLFEIWPEIKDFISQKEEYNKRNLPVKNLDALNKKLKLPPIKENKKAA